MSDIDEEVQANWRDFDLSPVLIKSLLSNGYEHPTLVQSHSLKYVKFFSDLIISARTGEGKTLCFLLPILNNLIDKYESQLKKHGLKKTSDEALLKPIRETVFRQTKALILSPTRELAVQIRDHLEKIIPEEYKKLITSCELIGGMSLLKQQRKLSYKPTILIGTPGRVWELIDDIANEYLTDSLPKNLEVLVLDEADRMVEIGHYKEMNDILDFVYIKREQNEFNKNQSDEKKEIKQGVIESVSKNMLSDQSKFTVGKNIENPQNDQMQALLDDAEDIGMELEDFDEDELVMEEEELNEIEQEMTIRKSKKKKNNHKDMRIDKNGRDKVDKTPKFVAKTEGIQTIVCSATLTLDAKGRIRPSKKNKANAQRDNFDALEEICKKLRFRQKHPKVINLTESLKMPDKLIETYHRCTNEEKDLYTYYFLQHHRQQSTIIFVNSITCIKRLSSMLKILQVPHQILHSKMQQRMRLKHFDRFKRDVITLKTEPSVDKTAVMVCTDVAARGLDIPNVDNIVHYQMPVNAEIYLHRCGRTARIGKEGLAFSLFAPEDEKKFKLIYSVLKGRDVTEIKAVHIDMVELKRYQGFINTAKELEKAIFDKKKKSLRANWLVKMSEETGIPISDELRKEVEGLEETEKDLRTKRQVKEGEEQNIKKKRIKKQEDKKIGELKKDFHNMKEYKNLANVSTRSSFLNPNNVRYLNNALFGLGQLNNHQINKTILIDYLKPDTDIKKKRKKSNVRHIKRHNKKRKRTLAKV